ncbi:MAG: GTP-binding protein [Gemmatimonadetes bacterium]|nr:GTP-binding protein [Gemmatimonadota bacterium]
MRLARAAHVVVLWAALSVSRGLFAQGAPILPTTGWESFRAVPIPVTPEQFAARLRPLDLRYAPPEPDFLVPPPPVKALYVNAWAFGSSKLWRLIRLADSTEINAFVVDVKDDTGCLLYPSAVQTALEIGANRCVRTRDVRSRLDSLEAHGIYAIARFVVAKDPLLAERKPRWSVQDVAGGLWRDRIGSAWVDAFNDSVWIYSARLAEEAVRLGFSEVQFDYVRFPDEPKERLATAIFAARRRGDTQRAAVARNIQMLKHRLAPLGVPVTFDIFGLTVAATGDMGIGQVWEDFITVADVVLPMVYPSHYYRGAYGFDRPNAHPYQVVRQALREALARSQYPNAAQIRPYLQAFTLGRRLPRYTRHEISEQIRAAEELGIHSWVLWNPRSVYQRDALRPSRTAVRSAGARIEAVSGTSQ